MKGMAGMAFRGARATRPSLASSVPLALILKPRQSRSVAAGDNDNVDRTKSRYSKKGFGHCRSSLVADGSMNWPSV